MPILHFLLQLLIELLGWLWGILVVILHWLPAHLLLLVHWLWGLLVVALHWFPVHLLLLLKWLWGILVFCICFVPMTIPVLIALIAKFSRFLARLFVRPLVILFFGEKTWTKLARRTNCRIELARRALENSRPVKAWRNSRLLRAWQNSAAVRTWKNASRKQKIVYGVLFCAAVAAGAGLYFWWRHCG